jgi:MoaA/NifB/PqqE/SkfB family radical SAM enzyme
MKRIALNITNKCNFSCKTCLREFERGIDLDLDIIRKVIPEIKKLNCRHISITGGEPILHSRFEEILEIIVSARINFNSVSNGFLWERYLPIMKKYKDHLTHMSFSLDGSTANIHDKIRKKGSFAKVIEGIENFKKEGIGVVIATCLNKINKDDQENIISLVRKLGALRHIFTTALETNFNKDIVLSEEERKDCLDGISISQKASSVGLRACASLTKSDSVSFCDELNLNGLMINPHGELALCCDTIRNGAVMGSLKKESFLDLYLKALDVANNMKKARAKILHSGNVPEGFYDCRFCNKFLSDYIKK